MPELKTRRTSASVPQFLKTLEKLIIAGMKATLRAVSNAHAR